MRGAAELLSTIKPRIAVSTLAWASLLAAFVWMPEAPAASPSEQRLFEMTNRARADQRLSPLMWDAALARAAQQHAQWVVRNGELAHQYAGEADVASRAAQAGAHFQIIAENIAIGPAVESMQNQWMRSAAHRANILDPRLNAVGFAVIERGQYLYAVADFERNVPDLSLDQVEQAVERLVAAEGVSIIGPGRDARQTCEMSHGTAGGSSPRFVMRWQSADLAALPAVLEERLRSGHYRTAAVGACGSANAEQGFTSYRIAVLLY